MRAFARRAAVAVASVLVVAAVGTPAQAAANPYTAASACASDFGGSWAYAADGHRTITAGGTKVGDVYLMYNSATGYNCVATLKAVSVGSYSGVAALVRVEGGAWAPDSGNYRYYAAVQRYAADRCVMYSGEVLYGTSWYSNGRSSWGNCG